VSGDGNPGGIRIEIENCSGCTWAKRSDQFGSDIILQLIKENGFENDFHSLEL
jgi:hypothetical protein